MPARIRNSHTFLSFQNAAKTENEFHYSCTLQTITRNLRVPGPRGRSLHVSLIDTHALVEACTPNKCHHARQVSEQYNHHLRERVWCHLAVTSCNTILLYEFESKLVSLSITAWPLLCRSSLPSISSSPAPSLVHSLQPFLSTLLPRPCRTTEKAVPEPRDLAFRRCHVATRRTQHDAER